MSRIDQSGINKSRYTPVAMSVPGGLQEAMRAWYVVLHWLQVVSVLAGT